MYPLNCHGWFRWRIGTGHWIRNGIALNFSSFTLNHPLNALRRKKGIVREKEKKKKRKRKQNALIRPLRSIVYANLPQVPIPSLIALSRPGLAFVNNQRWDVMHGTTDLISWITEPILPGYLLAFDLWDHHGYQKACRSNPYVFTLVKGGSVICELWIYH